MIQTIFASQLSLVDPDTGIEVTEALPPKFGDENVQNQNHNNAAVSILFEGVNAEEVVNYFFTFSFFSEGYGETAKVIMRNM